MTSRWRGGSSSQEAPAQVAVSVVSAQVSVASARVSVVRVSVVPARA